MATNHNEHADADAQIKTDIITLTRYLTEAQHDLGSYATGDFTYVLTWPLLLPKLIFQTDCYATPFNSHSKALRRSLSSIHVLEVRDHGKRLILGSIS